MTEWLDELSILQFHRAQIAEHGGSHGVFDQGKLESTLAKPRQVANYEPDANPFRLAASCGYGFVKNHCFSDGNKRIALVAMDVFLQINDWELDVDEVEAAAVMLDLAKGELSEEELTDWVDNHAVPFNLDEQK